MVRYQSSKLAEERKKQLLWKSALVAIIFISLVFFISQFFKLDYFAIKIINIEGNEVIRESTLVENIKNEISKNYLWIFPKKNSLFYPRYLVKEKLLHDFPRILELNLNLDLPSTLDVSLKEREPHVLWCKSKIDEESEEGGEICFGSGGKIILSDTQIIREAMENFQAILNMEEFAEKDNIFKVEYFDLRFGNKVFYK